MYALGDNWNAAAWSMRRDGAHEVNPGAFADLSRPCDTRETRWMSVASELQQTDQILKILPGRSLEARSHPHISTPDTSSPSPFLPSLRRRQAPLTKKGKGLTQLSALDADGRQVISKCQPQKNNPSSEGLWNMNERRTFEKGLWRKHGKIQRRVHGDPHPLLCLANRKFDF